MHFIRKISSFPYPGLRVKTFPLISLLCFLTCYEIRAQIVDNFSDGNFNLNPSWYGSTDDFIVNASGQLQLNARAAGKSSLYTNFEVSPNQNTTWEFYVKQSFAPSGANFGRFYLMSDVADFSGSLNGYFLQFGEAGSGDAIELFRQTGTVFTSICRASAGVIASPFALLVRVTRENNGDWRLMIAYDGTSNFVAEAFGRDNVHQVSHFTGVLCTYTITNVQRFYYDDFYLSTIDAGDVSAPEVLSLEVMTSSRLKVTFSEEMDSVSVSDPLMYFVPEISVRAEISELQADKRTVMLSFSDEFRNGYQHTLQVHGVADVPGNVLKDTAIAFLFFDPRPTEFKDIILTEILADPSPPVALPEAEYVELYNRSSHPVDLSGWTISDESTSAQLGALILLPGAYVVLTNASEKFEGFRDVMDVSLPSLNNSGDVVALKDAGGVIVDSVAYSDSWYSKDAEDGGRALELIDTENLCAGSRNWAVSESRSGGTPGAENSVKASLADNIGPVVWSVAPSDSITLHISFNEALDHHVPPVDRFRIYPETGIASARFTDSSLANVTLILGTPLRRGETYTLTIHGIYDCSGNLLQDEMSSSQFLIPEQAEKEDIVINEILFNPMAQGVDFVEVYNRSGKVIDLKNWSLANSHNQNLVNPVILPAALSIIRPGEYRAFTEDVNVLKGEYIAGQESAFRETDLPALNDDEGQIVLRDDSGRTIDSVFYSEDYHSPFVRDSEGISLERISVLSPGIGSSNWRSASAQTGFATPGYANSNARTQRLLEETVTIEPEVIQPGDDLLSFSLIKYQFAHGGLMANVMVLDQQGRSIRQLALSELLGIEGFFRWDGDLDDGSAASVGYYVVQFEIFNADGMVQVIRKRLAIF